MSTELSKALEFANYRVTLNNQLEILRSKTQDLLSYSVNGGTFTVNRELITFCKILLEEDRESTVLLDIYNNPILVNLKEFYPEIMSRYIEVTNDFHLEYEKIRKARKVHRVLDINEDI